MSNTETLEKPDVSTGNDNDGEVFHYVKADQIVESAVEGKHVVALCGEVFPVTKVPKPNSPICKPCKEIHDRMKS